jgi:hypothetical protein
VEMFKKKSFNAATACFSVLFGGLFLQATITALYDFCSS